LPAVSPLFLEIQAALQSSKAPARQIGDLIARDTAATAKLLRVFNSAGFGGSRQITDLHQAVGVLGGQLAQWIVAAIALFNEYDRVKTAYFSMDQLWRSSIAVARLARDLALRHTGDAALADSAFAAGLLHDVGKAVLAGAFDEQYQAVQMVAREQQAPVWKIEKKNFGASHGEIGAYLLSLWGMPLDLLEAVTLHDHPSRSVNPRFSPLTAVHIAHVWEDELNTENDGTPAPQIDGTYLDEVGILDRLAGWRKSMSLPVSNQPVTTSVHRQAGQRAKSMPLGKCRRAPFFGGGGWPLAAAGAFILLLLGWFAFGPIVRVAAKFHGRAADGAAAESATETPRSNAVAPVAATNASTIKSVETPTADMVFPELKLSGIFFSLDRPSAIINGQLVHINGEVAGVHVVEIGPSRVTVEYQQHKKTLSL